MSYLNLGPLPHTSNDAIALGAPQYYGWLISKLLRDLQIKVAVVGEVYPGRGTTLTWRID